MIAKNLFKKFPGNSILMNIVAMVLIVVVLLILTMLFLNVYTRHGHNVVVPELKGLQAEEAEAILKSKGLKVLVVDSIYKKEAVPGSIIDQTPKPNNKVKEGRAIYLTIFSKNPQQIAVPELVDYSSRQALALLNSIGFTQVSVEEVPSEYHGLVLSVEYRGKKLKGEEQIPAGSPLKLIVGSGMVIDSLDTNQEYIVSPENVITKNDSAKTAVNKSNIDDSFFN